MTPKQIAVLNTFKVLAIGIGGGFFVAALLSFFTLEEIGLGLAIILLISAMKLTYEMELSKAESLAKLNEISKK
jgi:hypothetical protein